MKKILLPLILLAGMTLVGCGGSTPEPTPEQGYGVAITNKTELQAQWYAGEASRDLSITLTPEGNVMQELTKKTLTVASNNDAVVKVQGISLHALAQGTAEITVTYHGWKDKVSLNIEKMPTVQEKYGVTHSGTSADPLTNEEALTVAKHEDYAKYNDDLYVGGKIDSFYHAPGARDDGAVSWFLEPAAGQTERFEVYKCYKTGTGAASYLTEDDVWVGGYAVAHGKFTKYNSQYETDGAIFDRCEGTKPAPRTTIAATFAEALAAGAALKDGADTYDYYQFDAYVTAKEGDNYFLTASKGEALVKAKSDADHGERDYYSNAIEIYNGKDIAAKLTKNAKITVKMILKNYHGQVENALAVKDADVTVLEAGEDWVINYQEVTFAGALEAVKALADGATSEGYYKFSGIVTEIKYAWSDTNKNMSFNMKGEGDNSENPEVIYTYKISTEDATLPAKVAVDAKVTVGGKLQNYVKNDAHTYELVSGLILAVEEQGGGGGGGETTDVVLEAGTNGSACKVNVASDQYDGIKVGTGSKAGDMKIKVPATATKVTFHGAAWNGKTAVLTVTAENATVDQTSLTLVADTGISGNSPFTLAGEEATYVCTLNLSNVTGAVTITLATTDTSNGRFVIWHASAE